MGEILDPIPFPAASPTFYRVEKVEAISPTSSKTETVDISPKLAISDDEDIFWEVTKVPDDKMQEEPTKRHDYVDGNHPNVHEITTHDHVDQVIGQNPQTKRVKKILPPFESAKRNARNTSGKIAAIKTSDIKEMNHSKGSNNTNNSLKNESNSREDKSLIKKEKLSSLKNINNQGELIIETETNGEIIENGESINKKDKGSGILEKNFQQLSKKRINEDGNVPEKEEKKLIKDKNKNLKFNRAEVKVPDNDMPQNINLPTPHMATNPSFQQKDYGNDMKYENNKDEKKNAGKAVVDNKYPDNNVKNFFVQENPFGGINIQNSSRTGVPNPKETTTSDDPDSVKTFTTSRQTKDVDVAPDWKNSKTTPLLPKGDNGSKEYLDTTSSPKEMKIQNPEFLYPNIEIQLGKSETSGQNEESDYPELKKESEDSGDEIEGIRLVPNEFGVLIPSSKKNEKESSPSPPTSSPSSPPQAPPMPTTQRSIWDLLKEREQFNPDSRNFDKEETTVTLHQNDLNDQEPKALPYQAVKTTAKTLYNHFDTDSAEIEYETENFQHGYSNIEKHELPFSEALPWLEIKDKEFDVPKKEEKMKKMIHTKINDFPNILPINKNHFENNEEMQIPRDLSKLLKLSDLSQNENSVNGVTVSIVDSGTNNDDYSRYGHRPSKWYLLLLTGNSTIVKLRRKDFTKYLKLNLAARLSVEYDDIKVNKVILAPPKVLVNISVYAPSDDIAEESQFDLKEKFEDKGEAPLYKLAETNATLLELSGEEYHVVRFLSLQSQKPEAEAQKDTTPNSVSLAISKHDDIEFVIYTFLGSACACAVILTLFITLSKYFKKITEYEWPWNKPKISSWKVNHHHHRTRPDQDEFNGISPAVIYSGGFPQIRGSWMTGVGARTNQTTAEPPNYAPSILQQYPGIELGVSQPHHKNTCLYPELEDRPTNSPRHNKLQMYNCGANNIVIPIPPLKESTKAIDKGNKPNKNEGSDTHPLDVRIDGGKIGQDNPNFTN